MKRTIKPDYNLPTLYLKTNSYCITRFIPILYRHKDFETYNIENFEKLPQNFLRKANPLLYEVPKKELIHFKIPNSN